jgi:glucose-1-phosphate thymidylyltransferase
LHLKQNLIGIIPAAGKGTRLAPFPCPKELFPIGFQDYLVKGQLEKRPKVVSQYIIENMIEAGVRKILIIIGQGKQDVVEYYGDGSRFGVQIGYIYQEQLNGMPAAIDLARPWLHQATIVFGMPDTIITPITALKDLLADHISSQADLSLGLFKTDRPHKFGMVECDNQNRVISTIDKPLNTNLTHMWGACCWSPKFTELLNSFANNAKGNDRETVLGDVFNEAIHKQFNVRGYHIANGRYIDIGTADELNVALREFHSK